MVKQPPLRQRIRRGVILVSFIIFPIIMNYFSPYVIIDGASQGIVNGSFVVFGLMFLSALFLGRAWCGWGCPAGGLQEAATKGGRQGRLVVVVAHIDARMGSPGASDNASGPVVLLLLAELLASYAGQLGSELVAMNVDGGRAGARLFWGYMPKHICQWAARYAKIAAIIVTRA